MVWNRSTGGGIFGGEFGACHLAYVCYSAATRPCSQITLDRLVVVAVDDHRSRESATVVVDCWTALKTSTDDLASRRSASTP